MDALVITAPPSSREGGYTRPRNRNRPECHREMSAAAMGSLPKRLAPSHGIQLREPASIGDMGKSKTAALR